MNRIKTINTEYLRASRTIDIIEVSDKTTSTVFYIYNYEGYSFRVFTSHENLINFLLRKTESDVHFCTEHDLDEYLFGVKLIA
ncbi:hypothetical protein [Flavicella sediminum]|uniref:hypothetical protein n=1 Tax=Flavicella sediminum TaxID=2585141 RepID=UPI00111FA81E|nr:hypothetical protein [Flavicella sediminum]